MSNIFYLLLYEICRQTLKEHLSRGIACSDAGNLTILDSFIFSRSDIISFRYKDKNGMKNDRLSPEVRLILSESLASNEGKMFCSLVRTFNRTEKLQQKKEQFVQKKMIAIS
jgi:hypothetical protein